MRSSIGNKDFTCNTLIINSQKQTSDFISNILINLGIKLQSINSIDQLSKIIQIPDVILIQMDSHEELTIYEILKKKENTKNIPIIHVLNDKNINKSKFYEIGADDVITLPIDPIELLNKIKIQFTIQELIKKNELLKFEIEKNKKTIEDEEKLRSIMESINDLVLVLDKNGIFCNFYQTYNRPDLYVSPDIFLGKSFKEIMPLNVIELVDNAIDALEKTSEVQQINYFLETPYGKRWFNAKISKLLNSLKEFIGFTIVIHDITEQKKLEEIMEKERQDLKLIIDSLPIMVFYKDKDGKFIRVNKALAKIFNKSEKYFVGKTVFDLFSYQTAQNITKNDNEVLKTCNSKLNIIEQYKTNNGLRWIQTNKIPIFDKNNNSTGLICFAQDITEQKRTEELIKKHIDEIIELNKIAYLTNQSLDLKEIFNLILSSSSALFNAEGGIIYNYDESKQLFSPAAYKGISNDTINELTGFKFGQGLSGRVAESGDPVVLSDIALDPRNLSPAAIREGWHSYAGVPIKSKNKILGVMVLISQSIDYFKKEQLNILNLIGNLIGIAIENTHLLQLLEKELLEHKQTENALKISEAKLSNAMKIANLGHWEYDVAKDIFTFNDNFYAIYHTTAEKEGGYTMTSTEYSKRFLYPDDMLLVRIETSKAIETSDPDFSRYVEHRIIYEDGQMGYIAVRFFIIKDDKGNTIKTYGVNQDITERKIFEEELKKSLKEKELLLMEINHRVKNNLNVILSLLKYQEDNIKDPDSKEKYQKIENRIYSIALIHSMLYKTKNIFQINFKEYINDLVNYLIVSSGEKSGIIKVLFNIEEFEFDIDQIKTLGLMLNELLTNSLKYAFSTNKKIKRKIILSLNYEKSNYIVKIKDNGKGLPENFDINKTTTSGLYLVKILCEEINGILNFTSNNGVEITIKFPIKKKGGYKLSKK